MAAHLRVRLQHQSPEGEVPLRHPLGTKLLKESNLVVLEGPVPTPGPSVQHSIPEGEEGVDPAAKSHLGVTAKVTPPLDGWGVRRCGRALKEHE